jgi:CRP/FNR family transcriptional regulator, cyclic AMP receptor protein
MNEHTKSLFNANELLKQAAPGRTVLKPQKHTVIYSQGDHANSAFYIQSGRIKFTVASEQGKEAVVAILGGGDIFGEGCLNGHAQRSTTAIALTQCVITQITKSEFVHAVYQVPSITRFFIGHLLNRKRHAESNLADRLLHSCEKRLARTLLHLANSSGEYELESIPPSIHQETLAAMVGTTRSRINLFMNKFRKMNLINYGGKIRHIKVNRDLLRSFVEENLLILICAINAGMPIVANVSSLP